MEKSRKKLHSRRPFFLKVQSNDRKAICIEITRTPPKDIPVPQRRRRDRSPTYKEMQTHRLAYHREVNSGHHNRRRHNLPVTGIARSVLDRTGQPELSCPLDKACADRDFSRGTAWEVLSEGTTDQSQFQMEALAFAVSEQQISWPECLP